MAAVPKEPAHPVVSRSPLRGTRKLLSILRTHPRERFSPLWFHTLVLILSDLLVLHCIDDALVVFLTGGPPAYDALLYILAGLLPALHFRTLLKRSAWTVNEAIRAMRRRLLTKAHALDLCSFEALGADEVYRRIALDGSTVHQASLPVAWVIRAGTRAVASTLFLMLYAPDVAVLAVGGVVTIAAFRVVRNIRFQASTAATSRLRDRLHGTLLSLHRGFEQVRLHRARSNALTKRIRHEIQEVGALVRLRQQEYFQTDVMAHVITNALLVYIAVTFGDLPVRESARLFLVLLFVMRSVDWTIGYFKIIAHAGMALDRMRDLESGMDAALERWPAPPPASLEEPPPFAGCGLKQVAFTYPSQWDDLFEFGPLDLELNPGEVVFLTGPNGCGKSTALKLLLGLYPPQSGHVVLNGEAQPARPSQAYRDQFSVVLSEPVLFERLLGLEDVPTERVTELLDYVGLADKVSVRNGRFSTIALSTGQRKRLAMVVALLQDRPVFVFDEWAADQDPGFRDAFYTRILPDLQRRGKTVLAVTHDDGFFDLADRRVRMRDGRVVEERAR